jgi:N-acetylglutamate synthase-like GNAT family acetyltransferase
MGYRVVEYEDKYQQAVIDLILPIQQKEFNVPVTLHDQPDLQNIPSYYQKNNGNFWIALDNHKVVGTIGIIDFSGDQVALRKMFVRLDYRGKEKGIAQLLLDKLKDWCKQKKVKSIFLGTVDAMHAAHRFYQKNGFTELLKTDLPETFPLVRVDNKFFKCTIFP